MTLSSYLLILVIAQPATLQATDWPTPESAWLETPDGFLWPDDASPIELPEVPTAELDARLGGALVPALESTVIPPFLRASWVELQDGGEPALLYVDPALSGTGGKYVYVTTRIDGEWSWIGEMLCRQVLVGAPKPGGWQDLTCIGQRGLHYQRVLFTMHEGRYCAARNERHDLERGVVEIYPVECGPRNDP